MRLIDQFKEKLFQRYLVWLCRPARLRRHLKSVLPQPYIPAPVDRKRVRAAALQVELKLFKNPLAYADEMHRRVKEAFEAGAQIVAFPEYNSLPLFGMLPGIDQLEKSYQNAPDQSAGKNTGSGISLADIFSFMTPAVKPFIDLLFSSLAQAYGVYIMAGSYPFAEAGTVVNRSFLYSPEGRLIGSQDKVHLLPVEAEWQLKRGRSFSHFDTPLGRLAIPVCMDATYYETFRILESHRVDIVLLPIANLEEYNYWLALRGIWPRVQESVIYGIKSSLVGSVAGFTFTGRAGIFAPLEITPKRDGVLAEVESFSSEAMAVAELNLDALHQLRLNHPWRDHNPTLT
ncbi:MAG: nitrilase [Firmicutes bacterium]|nr:nitrilase [Bacillota bacterium]